jgi:hypothetical protein
MRSIYDEKGIRDVDAFLGVSPRCLGFVAPPPAPLPLSPPAWSICPELHPSVPYTCSRAEHDSVTFELLATGHVTASRARFPLLGVGRDPVALRGREPVHSRAPKKPGKNDRMGGTECFRPLFSGFLFAARGLHTVGQWRSKGKRGLLLRFSGAGGGCTK